MLMSAYTHKHAHTYGDRWDEGFATSGSHDRYSHYFQSAQICMRKKMSLTQLHIGTGWWIPRWHCPAQRADHHHQAMNRTPQGPEPAPLQNLLPGRLVKNKNHLDLSSSPLHCRSPWQRRIVVSSPLCMVNPGLQRTSSRPENEGEGERRATSKYFPVY